MDFRFKLFSGPKQHVPAMRKLIDLTEANNFTTGDKRAFVWSMIFSVWIPDEVNESFTVLRIKNGSMPGFINCEQQIET